VTIQAPNGKFLCTETNGTVVANREKAGGWESFTLDVNRGGFSLKSAHGKYLCADKTVIANRDRAGGWETFHFTREGLPHPISSGQYIIKTFYGNFWNVSKDGELFQGKESQIFDVKAHAESGAISLRAPNGKYVTVEANDHFTVNRDEARGWEHFVVVPSEGGFGLRSSHGKYVCADAGEKMIANRGGVGAWERFQFVTPFPTSGVIGLKSSKGKFLCLDHAKLIADRASMGGWEKWTIHDGGGDKIGFTAHTGKFLAVEANGVIVANREKLGGWEKFTPVGSNGVWAFKAWTGKYLGLDDGGLLISVDAPTGDALWTVVH